MNEEFIKKNKNKGSILYNNCEFELKEYFGDIDINNKKNVIKIILCLNRSIEDISFLFCFCDKLLSIKKIFISDYYKINNQSNEINGEYKDTTYNPKDNFFNISNNIYYNDYSFTDNNTEDILQISTIQFIPSESNSIQINFPPSFLALNNISYLFYRCNSLISLPDISKWDISNVKNMEGLFGFCSSLKSMPDISEWNTSNVENMNNMFYECNSLISLPDISKWNTSNVYNMEYMFSGCISLISLPNISKWNISNVKDMRNMLYECYSLLSLPDITEFGLFLS